MSSSDAQKGGRESDSFQASELHEKRKKQIQHAAQYRLSGIVRRENVTVASLDCSEDCSKIV